MNVEKHQYQYTETRPQLIFCRLSFPQLTWVNSHDSFNSHNSLNLHNSQFKRFKLTVHLWPSTIIWTIGHRVWHHYHRDQQENPNKDKICVRCMCLILASDRAMGHGDDQKGIIVPSELLTDQHQSSSLTSIRAPHWPLTTAHHLQIQPFPSCVQCTTFLF